MKTAKNFLAVGLLCILAFTGLGATIQWYSQQPVTTTPRDTDIMVLETTGPQGYKSFTLLTLKDWIGTNGPSIFYITNLVVNNLYGSNAYFTNVTVLNEFHGRTTFISNAYITNLITSNAYITNLYTSTNYANTTIITNNLFSSNAYITNIYTINTTTNYFLFSTNLYITNNVNNSYVSNYFYTNVFLNTYMSNFFNTNLFLYQTNIFQYSTNLTVTNFYAGDTFVSNYFNTNIFTAANTYVSNFFVTNLYNTVNIASNYFVQLGAPLTNATLYGTTTFSPISGTQPGRISIVGSGVETISLSGSNASITANVFWFKTNSWAGPTNNIPMNLEDQYYTTSTDINTTNINNLPPTGYGAGVLLSISNSSAANIVWRFPSSIKIPERTNAVVVSNGTIGILSIKYTPVGPNTQAVYRQF